MIKLKNTTRDEILSDTDGETTRKMFGVSYEELENTVKRLEIINDLSPEALQKVLDDKEITDNVKLWFVFALGYDIGTDMDFMPFFRTTKNFVNP